MALMGFADDPSAVAEKALQAVHVAIRLDDRNEYSHWILGGILGQVLGQHDKAIVAYRRALELNPHFSVAYGSLGSVATLAGRLDEGIRNNEICIRLNPRDPSIPFRYAGLSLSYFLKEHYASSLEWAERAVGGNPEWWLGHALLAASHAFLGEAERAKAAIRDLAIGFPRLKITHLPPLPFKDAKHAERLREGLRRAGMPA